MVDPGGPADPEKSVDEILADWLYQRARGAPTPPDEVIGAHPELAEVLRSRFAALEAQDDPPASEPSANSDAWPASPPSSASSLLEKLASGERPEFTREGEIARGGMGAIVKIRDETLRRDLAMKVILEERTSGDSDTSSSFAHRFLEEAQVTAQLDHPGVVPVHELGVDDEGRLFFTMKLVKGRTLGEIFRMVHKGEEDWTRARAVQLVIRICETLAFAHSKGVIHRDLKPANVMVGAFGEVYVMDWGLAKVLGEHAEPEEPDVDRSMVLSERTIESATPTSPQLTQAGAVIGTPTYMALEQALGKPIDARSDVYAIGAMLYELLAGHPAYREPDENRTGAEVLYALMEGPPTPLSERAPDLPGEIIAIVDKAMARRPGDRYQSASELGEELRHFIEGRVVRAYRTGPVIELKKWIQRNRGLAAAILAAVVFAIGGLSITLVVQDKAAARLKVARDEANDNAQLAQANEKKANELALKSEKAATAEAAAAARAKENAERAKRNEERANSERVEAEKQAYFAGITAANLHLGTGNTAEAKRMLARCPEPLRAFEWKFQNARLDTSLAVLDAKIGRGGLAAFSGDGTRFVVNSFPALYVYDTATRKLVTKIERPRTAFYGMRTVLNADGTKAFATANMRIYYRSSGQSALPRVYVLDVASGKPLKDLRVGPEPRGEEHKGPPKEIWISHLMSDRARSVIVAFVQTRTEQEGRAKAQAIHAWDAATSKLVVKHSLAQVKAIALSPDGKQVAVLTEDELIRVLQLATLKPVTSWKTGPQGDKDLAFSSDGSQVVVVTRTWGAEDRVTVVKRESATGSLIAQWKPDRVDDNEWREWIRLPDSDRYVASSANSLRVLEFGSTQAVTTLRGHENFVNHISASPDGRTLVSAGYDGAARVWEASGGEPSIPLRDRARTWAQSLDGSRLFLVREATIEVIDSATGETLRVIPAPDAASMAVSPDSRRIATGGARGTIRILDAVSGEMLHTVTPAMPEWSKKEGRAGYEFRESHVSFSPDGRMVASSTGIERNNFMAGGPLHVWSADTGKLLATLDGSGLHTPPLFTADGERLVSPDGVWKVGSWERLGKFKAGSPTAMALSADGKLMATEGAQSIRLWSTTSFERVAELEGHVAGKGVLSIAFSPDGKRLVSGDQAGTLRIWDVPSRDLVSAWHESEMPKAGMKWKWIDEIGFSPDGKRLIFCFRGNLTVWDTDRESVRRLWRHWNARAKAKRGR